MDNSFEAERSAKLENEESSFDNSSPKLVSYVTKKKRNHKINDNKKNLML
jgi:hypothetical protein